MIIVVEQIELHLIHGHSVELAFRESFCLIELYNSNYITSNAASLPLLLALLIVQILLRKANLHPLSGAV